MTDHQSLTPTLTTVLDDACCKANEYQRAGLLEAAETVYRAVLQAEPRHPVANYQLGLLVLELQSGEMALPYLLQALEARPETASYWLAYLKALISAGQLDIAREVLVLGQGHGLEGEAVDCLAEGLNLPPDKPVPKSLPAKPGTRKKSRPSATDEEKLISLFDLGRYSEGVILARAMTERFPQHGFGWKLLGALLRSQGDNAAALAPMQKSTRLAPRDEGAQSNLGLVFADLNHFAEAEACHRRALAINPRFAQAHSNLGVALKSQGHQAEAEACFRKAIALNADCADAYNNLGTTLCEQRRFVEAEEAYVQALRVRPEFAEACYCLGSVLIAQQRLSEAETQLRKAVAYRPNYLDAHLNLGVALSRLGQFKKAKNCFQAVLAINPECDEAYAHLGVAESGLGETDLAIRYCRKAIEAKPGNANAHSGLLFMQSHSAMVDAAALFAEHCRYGEQFEAPLRDSWPQHTNTRDPERCLQIGFISADLYNHAVANFIEPIWACLADCPKVSLHAYYNDTIEDDVTRRLRAHVKQWHAIAFLPEADLAEKILEDKIDILIDLSGHTGKNRLLAFARKPAPVQASWMGYPGTTGLQAMDYYFADRYFLPPGQFDDQFTEKPVYLPVSVPFLPYESALPINDLPALSAGYLTFGSFNRLSKLSISTIALWSQLLRAVPECQ